MLINKPYVTESMSRFTINREKQYATVWLVPRCTMMWFVPSGYDVMVRAIWA